MSTKARQESPRGETEASVSPGRDPVEVRIDEVEIVASRKGGRASGSVRGGSAEGGLDALMERASTALAACDYFKCEDLCLRALEKCVATRDFERASRVVMPLQEARRQLRHLATDAATSTGAVRVLRDLPRGGASLTGGCYLLEPPLVGIDARSVRAMVRRVKAPALVLVKEPTTKGGMWPIVGVGTGEPFPVVVRVRVPAWRGLEGLASLAEVEASRLPDVSWFLATQERLGDAALAKVMPEWPADHRVHDLLELLEAVPDHEKLAQTLAHVCREASKAPASTFARRRGVADNPHSF